MSEKPKLDGKCPKCDQLITQVGSSTVDIKVPFGATQRGVSYFCPSCQVVLSVQIDPMVIKSEIVSELLAKLPRRPL
jgi:phage FluMu protein Com